MSANSTRSGRRKERIYREGFVAGVKAAASLAAEYPTTHPYRLDDCIEGKLNVTRRKRPRRRALSSPEAKAGEER